MSDKDFEGLVMKYQNDQSVQMAFMKLQVSTYFVCSFAVIKCSSAFSPHY